ncbi:hypothetical protein RUESEDTHA_03191 [Ruegeria sp. THAF57]|uniref:hypothetical protein n=1 Tax=Ruegeria sp. THAF57 TaxID=2744555 RepID=UPI0015DE119B|nr:hypothetical protein [Ruegeria sp. THAF57]CAD0186284.1 hypothetical protein RUESEDTHA_03191 [Ruegeria sp. THAF57]
MSSQVVFVIGTGRSGTSLTTQALSELGAKMPDDPVPASANNLRGTGESMQLRDQMNDLKTALGHKKGFRPKNWEQHPATQHARCELSDYLLQRSATSGRMGFIAKIPVMSEYLPMCDLAASEARVRSHYVWATRGAAETLNSLMRSYNFSKNQARKSYLQRLYYILRDAPDDTILIPYERWAVDSKGQIEFLADLIGQNKTSCRSEAEDAFTPTLDHSRSADLTALSEVEEVVDALTLKKRCRLADLVDRNSPEFFRLMTCLADEISRLNPDVPTNSLDVEQEMRLALLTCLADTSEKEAPEMNANLEILEHRVREVSTQQLANQEAFDKLTLERDSLAKVIDKLTLERDLLEEKIERRFYIKIQDLEDREAKLRLRKEKGQNKLKEDIKVLRQQNDQKLRKISKYKKVSVILAIPYVILTAPISIPLIVFFALKREARRNNSKNVT